MLAGWSVARKEYGQGTERSCFYFLGSLSSFPRTRYPKIISSLKLWPFTSSVAPAVALPDDIVDAEELDALDRYITERVDNSGKVKLADGDRPVHRRGRQVQRRAGALRPRHVGVARTRSRPTVA